MTSVLRRLALAVIATAALAAAAAGPAQAAFCQNNRLFQLQGTDRTFDGGRTFTPGPFVAAELDDPSGYTGMLRARTDEDRRGPWENFRTVCLDFGRKFAIRASNGLYVTAEVNRTGDDYAMLRARSGHIGTTEVFSWEPFFGNVGYLRSNHSKLYVSEERSFTGTRRGMLRARTSQSRLDAWERFQWWWR